MIVTHFEVIIRLGDLLFFNIFPNYFISNGQLGSLSILQSEVPIWQF